jgi:hypothetical protein
MTSRRADDICIPARSSPRYSWDDNEPQIYLWMAPFWKAAAENPKVQHFIRFDARTAKVKETGTFASRFPRSHHNIPGYGTRRVRDYFVSNLAGARAPTLCSPMARFDAPVAA